MIVSRLPSFPNSTEAPCAVTYRCKFFWKTLCCMNSKYTFTTSCLNFEYHRRKNSLVWDSLSQCFSKVFDCSIKFSCACGTYDLAQQVSRSANFNLQDSWTTVDVSINNCGLANSFAAVDNLLASSSLPYLCFERCPADIIFILQELKIICSIWNSFFNSVWQKLWQYFNCTRILKNEFGWGIVGWNSRRWQQKRRRILQLFQSSAVIRLSLSYPKISSIGCDLPNNSISSKHCFSFLCASMNVTLWCSMTLTFTDWYTVQ